MLKVSFARPCGVGFVLLPYGARSAIKTFVSCGAWALRFEAHTRFFPSGLNTADARARPKLASKRGTIAFRIVGEVWVSREQVLSALYLQMLAALSRLRSCCLYRSLMGKVDIIQARPLKLRHPIPRYHRMVVLFLRLTRTLSRLSPTIMARLLRPANTPVFYLR